MSGAPKITVFMPVYNGKRFLAESVGSILGQSHGDFEFLVIDDASTDGSLEFLEGQGDPRIRTIRHEQNQGIQRTYNHGLREARGELFAVMDQDDISKPERLERQLAFLQGNPSIGLCGTRIEPFGDAPSASWVRYLTPDDLKTALLFENPICHPSVMLRLGVLRESGLDYPDYPYAEEYALWIRMAGLTRLANLDENLLRYRAHAGQVSRARSETQSASVRRLAREQLGALGASFSERDLVIHSLLGSAFAPVPRLAGLLRRWTARLIAANRATGRYPKETFEAQLVRRANDAQARNKARLAKMSPRLRIQWLVAGGLHYLRSSGRRNAPVPA